MVVIPSPDRVRTLANIAAQLTYDLHSFGYSVGEITSIVGSVLGATLSECDPENRIIFARALMETMQTKLGLELDQHGRWILRKESLT